MDGAKINWIECINFPMWGNLCTWAVAILHSQCTLPRTFTYQACPFSVHCLSFNALPAEIRTRNHGISTVLMFLTNSGKFCTCSDKFDVGCHLAKRVSHHFLVMRQRQNFGQRPEVTIIKCQLRSEAVTYV